MADVETIHLRGEGGSVFAFDLPLPEPIAERLAKQQLVRVNEDGTPHSEDAEPKRKRTSKPAEPAQGE